MANTAASETAMPSRIIDTLSQRFAHIAGVSFAERNELTSIVINNSHAHAEILLQGAQLVAFTPINEKPLIWNSPLASFKKAASSRGGIPVCWPWFGDAARNPAAVRTQLVGDGLPAHGFVRGIDWQIDAINVLDDGATEVTLSLDVDAAMHACWGFTARLVVTHRIAATLTTTFETENRDTRAFCFSTALHTYFAVGNIEGVSIEGFDGCSYIDALDGWKIRQQNGDVAIDREVDRIYLDTPALSVIRDACWQREIIVEAQGSRSAVVWNPWIEKSKRLSDFAPDARKHMLCIETANVIDDIVSLVPGEKHCLGVAITCRRKFG